MVLATGKIFDKAAGFVIDAATGLVDSAANVFKGAGRMWSADSVGEALSGAGQAGLGALDVASTVGTGGAAAVGKTVAKNIGKTAIENAVVEGTTTIAAKAIEPENNAGTRATMDQIQHHRAEVMKEDASDLAREAEAVKAHASVLAAKVDPEISREIGPILDRIALAPSAKLTDDQIETIIDSALTQAEEAPDELANSLVKFLEAIAEEEKLNQVRNAFREILGSVDDLGSAIEDALPAIRQKLLDQPDESKAMVEKTVGALADQLARESEAPTAAPSVRELAPVAREVLEPQDETITVDKQLFEDMVKALEESKQQKQASIAGTGSPGASLSSEDAQGLSAVASPGVSLSSEDAQGLSGVASPSASSTLDAGNSIDAGQAALSDSEGVPQSGTLATGSLATAGSLATGSETETSQSFEDRFTQRANELGDAHKAKFSEDQKSIDDSARSAVSSPSLQQGSGLSNSTSSTDDLISRGKAALSESEIAPQSGAENFEDAFMQRSNELGDAHKAKFSEDQRSIDDSAARGIFGGQQSGQPASGSTLNVGATAQQQATSEQSFIDSFMQQANQLGQAHQSNFLANQQSIDKAAQDGLNGGERLQF